MEELQVIHQHLLPFSLSILRLVVWLALLGAIFVPVERLCAAHPQKIFRTAILTDLLYYFLSSLVPSVLLSTPLALLAWGAHRLLPDGVATTVAQWPLSVRLVVALVVGEIGFYWGHRWSHEVPLLWRFHAIHHSAEHIDWLVNTRAHPVDMVFTRLCGLVPLYVLGLAAPHGGEASLVPTALLLIGTVWGFFIHANVRWRFGLLERFIATPGFHHWHHTNDGADVVDKNYAALLPWIDGVFGTLYLPKGQRPVRYGVDQPMSSSLFGQLLQPFEILRQPVAPGVRRPELPTGMRLATESHRRLEGG